MLALSTPTLLPRLDSYRRGPFMRRISYSFNIILHLVFCLLVPYCARYCHWTIGMGGHFISESWRASQLAIGPASAKQVENAKRAVHVISTGFQ